MFVPAKLDLTFRHFSSPPPPFHKGSSGLPPFCGRVGVSYCEVVHMALLHSPLRTRGGRARLRVSRGPASPPLSNGARCSDRQFVYSFPFFCACSSSERFLKCLLCLFAVWGRGVAHMRSCPAPSLAAIAIQYPTYAFAAFLYFSVQLSLFCACSRTSNPTSFRTQAQASAHTYPQRLFKPLKFNPPPP